MSQTIMEYYARDHDRLDGLFKTFQSTKQTSFQKAREAFVEFKFGLQRHIIWEEDILFPLFEKKTGMGKAAGPTAVMRTEHREIRDALEGIHSKVAKKDPDSGEAEQRLVTVLTQHNLKEEEILYPAIDRFLTETERQTVFKRMEEIPPERYETCC
ncbi:MAG: hemerythrin domain-containing protein [Deltaproteobacteria bacterium]|nr:hemerythrin domain-containing protein [Deltaproteobacteria bacterium]